MRGLGFSHIKASAVKNASHAKSLAFKTTIIPELYKRYPFLDDISTDILSYSKDLFGLKLMIDFMVEARYSELHPFNKNRVDTPETLEAHFDYDKEIDAMFGIANEKHR